MANNQKRLQLLPKLVSAALLLAANIFVFSTIAVFGDNPSEFESGFLSMFPVLALWGGMLFVLTLLPGFILPLNWLRRYISVVLALGLLTWFQAAFLLWDYGVFDGRVTEWQQFDVLGWLDIGIWLSLVALFLYFAKRIIPLTHLIAWILIFGQAVLLAVQGEPDMDDWTMQAYTREPLPQAMLELSRNKNIFHNHPGQYANRCFPGIGQKGRSAG